MGPDLDPYQELFYVASALLVFADPGFSCSYHVVQGALGFAEMLLGEEGHDLRFNKRQ